MRRLVVGNWKMNLTLAEATVLAGEVANFAGDFSTLQIGICPSFPWLVPVRESVRFMPHNFFIGAQSVSPYPHGAYTGDVSAEQLKGVVTHCLVGHSEQRRFHHLTSNDIQGQIRLLVKEGITPIVCFGEKLKMQKGDSISQLIRDLQQDLSGLDKQEVVAKCIFAYEPLWAIGTGNPASPDYVQQAVSSVKSWLKEYYDQESPRVLYGGSVTSSEAKDLKAVRELDGLLVGGASLHAKEFKEICARFGGRVS